MNLIDVEATPEIRIGGARLVTDEPIEGLTKGKVSVGFRPEAATIGDGPLSGRIRTVEDLGSEAFIHVQCEHEGRTESLVVKMPTPFSGRPGDDVTVQLRGKVHVFGTDELRLATVDAHLEA